MQEIWKDVEGYEGLYQVSNLGNIKSLNRYVNSVVGKNGKKIINGKIIKTTNRNGYKIVGLSKFNKRKSLAVHRLVCEAFIRKIKSEEVVNHIDYDKTNNNLKNLEIVTQLQNVTHSIKNMKTMHYKNPCKTNTNEPYITYDKIKQNYRITINKKEKRIKNFEEAINYRNKKLSEIGVVLNK